MIQSFMHVRSSFAVKEIFYTLQGEGANAGRAAVFCRFAGCNLWSGREEDRAKAVCQFCDTDFIGGERIGSAGQLAIAIRQRWEGRERPFVVLTGGEPTLQVTPELVRELHALSCEVAMETNGTRPAPSGLDWITVSPKYGTEIVQRQGDELKVVWPQPFNLNELAAWDFRHRFLQPMDGCDGATQATVDACLRDPRWRLSLQTHKVLGIR